MLTLFFFKAELRRTFCYSSLNLKSTFVLFPFEYCLTHKCDSRGEECNDVVLTFCIRVTVWHDIKFFTCWSHDVQPGISSLY